MQPIRLPPPDAQALQWFLSGQIGTTLQTWQLQLLPPIPLPKTFSPLINTASAKLGNRQPTDEHIHYLVDFTSYKTSTHHLAQGRERLIEWGAGPGTQARPHLVATARIRELICQFATPTRQNYASACKYLLQGCYSITPETCAERIFHTRADLPE